MENRTIIAGFGGQGVQSLGKLIARAAIRSGMEATFLPSYGPEMRGGTSNCSVVACDGPVASPIISRPDFLIAMNKPSLAKFETRVRPGGTIVFNGSLIAEGPTRSDVDAICVKANEIAAKAGNARAANMVALGAYAKASGIFARETILEVIFERFASKPEALSVNVAAFEAGYAL